MDKSTAWTQITKGLREIVDAAEMIEGFDLSETDLQLQVEIIKTAAQSVRDVAHEYIKPDKA